MMVFMELWFLTQAANGHPLSVYGTVVSPELSSMFLIPRGAFS